MNLAPGVALVLAAALIEGVAQVCLKRATEIVRRTDAAWLALGVGLFVIEIGLYTRALKTLDVAVAYPLSALSYASVVLSARLLLGERPDRRRWSGVLLIILGAACAVPQG
jgi:drug/metabolite transporter (DMT)-like permease